MRYLRKKGVPDSAMVLVFSMYVQTKGDTKKVKEILQEDVYGQELRGRLQQFGWEFEEDEEY